MNCCNNYQNCNCNTGDLSENNDKLKRELGDFVDLLRERVSDIAYDKNYQNIVESIADVKLDLNNAIDESLDIVNAAKDEVDVAVATVNALPFEEGVLSDSFVIKSANGEGQVARNQKDKNSDLVSTKDYGISGNGNNDTDAIQTAINSVDSLLVNTSGSIVDTPRVMRGVSIKGVSSTNAWRQDRPNRPILYLGHPTGTPGYRTELVHDVKVEGLTFEYMPAASSDDFAALHTSAVSNSVSMFNKFLDVENAISYGTSVSRDNYSLFDSMVGIRRMAIQCLGASYTRIIGLTKHNNGVDYTTGGGGSNDGGFGVGIRLANTSKGNIAVAGSIRDSSAGVTHQKGSNYNILSGMYYEGCGNAVHSTAGNMGRCYGNVHSGAVSVGTKGKSVSLGNTTLSRFDGFIGDNSEDNAENVIDLSSSALGYGSYYRVSYTATGSVTLTAGQSLTQGSISAELVSAEDDNFQSVDLANPLPSSGELIVKNLLGGVFTKGLAFDGLPITINKVYAVDGRHRVDASISNCNGTGAAINTDSNIVTLLASQIRNTALSINGSFNIVDIVIDDCSNPINAIIRGHKNIVRLIDNTKNLSISSLRLHGNNNIVTASNNGRLYIYGSRNTLNLSSGSVYLMEGSEYNNLQGVCSNLSDTSGVETNSKAGIIVAPA